MDVVLLRWPLEQERRERLEEENRLRLLLVEGGVPAPQCTDLLEDWIRVPADEADVRARVDGLAARYRAERDDLPELDRDGLLRFGGGWVPLPPVEARLMSALIERFGAVVSRDQLSRTGWPKGAPGRNALDVHVLRLRRRIAPLGLAIKTVRSRGYLLEAEAVSSRAGAGFDESHAREA
jgi:two-component system OmpR family response regulator